MDKTSVSTSLVQDEVRSEPIVARVVPKVEYFDRTNRGQLPLGPSIKFDAQEVSFEDLVKELREFEEKFGYSSIEMFSRYMGEEIADSDIEDWMDTFILYLGTGQIKRYSCP